MQVESLRWAIDYYHYNKIKSLVIQPKWMGSRFQVYLFFNPEECYGISRNGYRQEIDLTHEYQRLINRFKSDFDNGLQLRILDCELLPWRALGADLIDKSFYGLYDLINTEQAQATKYGFNLAYQRLAEQFDELKKDCAEITKEKFIKEKGHHVYANFKNFPLLKQDVGGIEQFKQQVDLYGQDGPLELKPFAILKDVYKDKEVVRITESNYTNFKFINDDLCWKLVLSDIESAKQSAQDIFSNLTFNQGYEGVVIKPEFVREGVAPYIKIRNSEYLRLVYGFDYLAEGKYEKLIKRKRIKNKLRKSIKDFENGLALLQVPYKEISLSNEKYVSILSKFVMSERENERIDPRL